MKQTYNKHIIRNLLDAIAIKMQYIERVRHMRILFVGDVVGSPGRGMIQQYVPALKKKYTPTVTIINGENAAGGRGITEKYIETFRMWGASSYTWKPRLG